MPARGRAVGWIFSRIFADETAPILSSIEVGNVSDSIIVLTYPENLDTTAPATTDFVVYGTSETVDSVVISGKTVRITLTGVISELETIFISYTAGTNPIRDKAGNNAANLVTQYVANHTTVYLRDESGDLIMGIELEPIPIGKREDDGIPLYCYEYQVVYDAMTSKPMMYNARTQNILVRSLKTAGVWAKLDYFYVFAQHTNDNGEALLNWVNPGTYNATLHGVTVPAFTAMEGFKGNGSTAYINTNAPCNALTNFSRDSASYGVYVRETTSGNLVVMGGLNYTWYNILKTHFGSNAYAIVNGPTTNYNANTGTGLGTYIANRSASDARQLYINGESVASDSVNSIAPGAVSMFILAASASGTPQTYSYNQVSIAFAGSSLTSTEASDMSIAIAAYIDSLNIIDAFVFAGQSNMMANTLVTDQTISGYNTELTNGYIWDKNEASMDLLSPGVNSTYDRPTGYYAGLFGPETSFIKDLSESVGTKLYAIKLAWGATSLKEGASVIGDWSEKTTGGLLDEWKGLINDADDFMISLGKRMRIRGIFWTQGEADIGYPNEYYQNLINFFTDVHTFCDGINTANSTDGKDVINIVTTLNPLQYGGSDAINTIIQAQKNFITNQGGVSIDTASYSLKIDGAHFNADSIIKMGRDAAAAVSIIYDEY